MSWGWFGWKQKDLHTERRAVDTGDAGVPQRCRLAGAGLGSAGSVGWEQPGLEAPWNREHQHTAPAEFCQVL